MPIWGIRGVSPFSDTPKAVTSNPSKFHPLLPGSGQQSGMVASIRSHLRGSTKHRFNRRHKLKKHLD